MAEALLMEDADRRLIVGLLQLPLDPKDRDDPDVVRQQVMDALTAPLPSGADLADSAVLDVFGLRG